MWVPSMGSGVQQVLSKASVHVPALPTPSSPSHANPCMLLGSFRDGGQSLTWVDILEQGFPDGVLQGTRVLGGREVFIRQVGLMDFPLKPRRTAGEKATWGTRFLTSCWGSLAALGQLIKGEVTSDLSAGLGYTCLLVPILASLAITLLSHL